VSGLAILLPPSEGKAPGGSRGTAWSPDSGRFGAALGPTRRELAALLAAADGGDERLLGVGGRHLERAQAANRALVGAPTLPASRRYTGVVHDAIGLDTLSRAHRAKAREAVVIVSGLLGLVALDDPVPDYRLKMGARIEPVGLLARRWRSVLGERLNAHLAGRTVIDLLPGEHAAAWAPDPSLDVLRVAFVERNGGAVAGHDAKAAKGRLVRHLLESRAAPTRALKTFTDERFRVVVG
jgi:cytoplasmic iron level regulating protein YaaA (DUF328/UPF0246 family)